MVNQILCVDDNEDTCLMLTVLLGLAHYQVATAGTFTQGLELAKSRQFNLYLLDLKLPDGSGLQLCRQIRSFDPVTPIILCSGNAALDNQQESMAAGGQAWLTKPVEPEVLTETIQRLLNKHPSLERVLLLVDQN
jgi:DNA-binding response OmpR family regulator